MTRAEHLLLLLEDQPLPIWHNNRIMRYAILDDGDYEQASPHRWEITRTGDDATAEINGEEVRLSDFTDVASRSRDEILRWDYRRPNVAASTSGTQTGRTVQLPIYASTKDSLPLYHVEIDAEDFTHTNRYTWVDYGKGPVRISGPGGLQTLSSFLLNVAPGTMVSGGFTRLNVRQIVHDKRNYTKANLTTGTSHQTRAREISAALRQAKAQAVRPGHVPVKIRDWTILVDSDNVALVNAYNWNTNITGHRARQYLTVTYQLIPGPGITPIGLSLPRCIAGLQDPVTGQSLSRNKVQFKQQPNFEQKMADFTRFNIGLR